MGTLAGVLDASHLRCGGSVCVATPKTLQDALRCNFFELRYPSPLGGIFAAPRLRRGGCESAAAPKTPQDAPRCDFIELSGPPPSWTSKNRSWASRRLQDLAKMGPKLEAKIISFGRPSWHPFGVGVGAPGRRRAFFLDAQVAPPKPPPTKKKNRILVLILYLAAIFFFGEGFPVGSNLGLQKNCSAAPLGSKTPSRWRPT